MCLLCLCTRLFICALWSPAGKGLTSWLSFVVSFCDFVTFPLVSMGYPMIVSISDLCTLTYFKNHKISSSYFIFKSDYLHVSINYCRVYILCQVNICKC